MHDLVLPYFFDRGPFALSTRSITTAHTTIKAIDARAIPVMISTKVSGNALVFNRVGTIERFKPETSEATRIVLALVGARRF